MKQEPVNPEALRLAQDRITLSQAVAKAKGKCGKSGRDLDPKTAILAIVTYRSGGTRSIGPYNPEVVESVDEIHANLAAMAAEDTRIAGFRLLVGGELYSRHALYVCPLADELATRPRPVQTELGLVA